MVTSEEPRERHGKQDSEYLLPADSAETDRLSLQHRVITRAFDGKLWTAPLKMEELEEADVLDAGTGNGVWLYDLDRRLNEALITPGRLIGVDMTDKQFPRDRRGDDRTSLEVANIVSLPPEWTDKFTLAHQRLLVAGLKLEEWIANVKELYRVVKPGCFVQIFETDHFVYDYPPGTPGDLLMTAIRRIFALKGLVPDILSRLPSMLIEAGFVDVHVVKASIPMNTSRGLQGTESNRNFYLGLSGLREPLLQAGALSSAAQFEEIMEGVRRQWDEEDIENMFQGVSARKPSQRQ